MFKEKLPEMELNGETHLQDGRRYSDDKVGTNQVRDANVTELGSEDNFPRYGNCYFCVMIERFTNG